MTTLIELGDSQGDGLRPFMAQIAARHGMTFDDSKSYTRAGAGVDELIQHASSVGPAQTALVFTGGANDPASLVNNQTSYHAKLVTLVNTLRAAGVSDIVLVGPFHSDDPAVQIQHEAARLVQARGVPGARWIDGFALTAFVPHPAGNPTHWTASGYRQISVELERALFQSGTVTAIGLAGTLAFLGAGGVVLMELLYSRAAGDVG